MAVPFIDLKAQYTALKDQIDQGIHKVLEHGMYVMGPEVKECEEALAKYTGSKHAIACASGTDALLMALMAVDIGPGDEVITTPFTFAATVETIVLAGATPVLVDIDAQTYNLDPKKIDEAVTAKTKAIMPVSLYGQPADMDEISAVAKKHNLWVIEDAAQSFGAPYKNKRSGNLSHISCTSFFPAKPLGCYGDGGAIFTSYDDLAEKLEQIRNHGQEGRYHHVRVGINGRMDSIQCAVLMPKLERFPWEVEQRERVAQAYTKGLAGLKNKGVITPHVKEDRGSVWAQYTLQVPNRETFQANMKELGIPTAVHYPSTIADQPAYSEACRTLDISNARSISQKVVSIPIFPDMTKEQVQEVIKAVEKSI